MAGIKIKIDPVDKILLKRNLNQNGQAQKFFSSEVRRMSDPYVPFQKGPLKNTARVYPNRIVASQTSCAEQCGHPRYFPASRHFY